MVCMSVLPLLLVLFLIPNGTGTDGEIWEIFLDGDDPDALWDAVRPLLEPGSLWPRAEVTMRSGPGSIRFPPGPPS